MDLFTQEPMEIPEDVVSPLECKKKLGSQAFRENQLRFRQYIKEIEAYTGLGFFEARKLFFEWRGTPEKISK